MKLISRGDIGKLKVGMSIIYKGRSNINAEANYKGKIVQIYKYHIVAEVTPIKDTSEEVFAWGEPTPYRVSICKNSIGCGDAIYI